MRKLSALIAGAALLGVVGLTAPAAHAAPAAPSTVTLQAGQTALFSPDGHFQRVIASDSYVGTYCDGNAYDATAHWISLGIHSSVTWDFGAYGVRPTGMAVRDDAGRSITIIVDRWEDSGGYVERGPGGSLQAGQTGMNWSGIGYRSPSSSFWTVHFYFTTRTSVGGGTRMYPNTPNYDCDQPV